MEEAPTRKAFPIQRFVVITLGMLVVLMWFDPSLRTAFASAASAILDPAIGLGGSLAVVTFLLAALITSLISTVSRQFFIDWLAMAKLQKLQSALNKEYFAAVREGNMSKSKKLQEARQGIQAQSFSNLKGQLKSMAVTFFVFLIMFAWMATFLSEKAASPLVSAPWAFSLDLRASTVLPHWILLYALFSSTFGMLLTRLLKYVSFTRILEARRIREIGG